VCQYRPQCQYVSSQTFSQKCRITATPPSKRLAVSPVPLQPSSPKYELKHYTSTGRIFLSPPYCNMMNKKRTRDLKPKTTIIPVDNNCSLNESDHASCHVAKQCELGKCTSNKHQELRSGDRASW